MGRTGRSKSSQRGQQIRCSFADGPSLGGNGAKKPDFGSDKGIKGGKKRKTGRGQLPRAGTSLRVAGNKSVTPARVRFQAELPAE